MAFDRKDDLTIVEEQALVSDDALRQLCGAEISVSEVSAVVTKLDTKLAAWRGRLIAGTTYPMLMVDTHYEQVRRDGQVHSTARLWVIGVSVDGYRKYLGC